MLARGHDELRAMCSFLRKEAVAWGDFVPWMSPEEWSTLLYQRIRHRTNPLLHPFIPQISPDDPDIRQASLGLSTAMLGTGALGGMAGGIGGAWLAGPKRRKLGAILGGTLGTAAGLSLGAKGLREAFRYLPPR